MLSQKAKYAIKALMLLGKSDGRTPFKIVEIASLAHIPHSFLEGILLELKSAGYLYSKRGHYGGYFLLMPPEAISLDKVVRLIDGPIARILCASQFHYRPCKDCADESACEIRKLFISIREAEVNLLASTSIADLIKKEANFFCPYKLQNQ